MSTFFSLKEFVNFFLLHYKKEVSVSDQMEFVNGWYIMIIISDILTIIGSVLKMEIQAKVKCIFVVMCFVLFFTIYAIVSIRLALIFFQNVRIRRENDFFQTLCQVNLKSITVSFLNLVRKSLRWSFSKVYTSL